MDRDGDVVPITLMGEIFAGQILANFAILRQIRDNRSQKTLNFVHSRK